jgi:hypothetical protein
VARGVLFDSYMLRLTRTTTIIAALMTGAMAATSPARAGEDDEAEAAQDGEAPVVSPDAASARVVSPLTTPDAPPAAQTEQHWYGWQVLAADAAGILGTVSCVSFSNADACVIPYFVAAPTVHLAHGRPMTALASVGVRLAFPIAGAMVGATLANCSAQNDQFLCGLGEMAAGVLVGTVVASVFDVAVLSTETRERPTAAPSRLSFLAPSVSAGPSGASFGLRGNF